MYRTRLPAFTLLVLSLLLSSCGWQLRGTSYANPLITSVGIIGLNPFSDEYLIARKQFKSTGYTFIDQVIEKDEDTPTVTPDFIVKIEDQDLELQEMARDASLGNRSQLLLITDVKWSLIGPEDATILQDVQTRAFRAYQNTSNQTNSEYALSEYDFALEDNRHEVAYLILQRLSSVKSSDIEMAVERAREIKQAEEDGIYIEEPAEQKMLIGTP